MACRFRAGGLATMGDGNAWDRCKKHGGMSITEFPLMLMTRWTSSLEMTRLLFCSKSFRRGCIMAYCPECEAVIEVEDDIEEGARMDCADCGAQLEVVNTNPVELGVVSTEEEEEDEAW